MSDLRYFRTLLEAAKDPMMIAFYQASVRELNGGVIEPCQHINQQSFSDTSYGSMYFWHECPDCQLIFDYKVTTP